MADPKAQARAAQEAVAEAKAAAKEAAVASAKAEARAESQAGAAAGGPPLGTTVPAGATGIAANVPLDVFTQRSAERTVARQAEADARDLTESEQRMAGSLGRGRVDIGNLRDIGATETPAFVSEERPGASRTSARIDLTDSPLGDRQAALRDSPDTEAEAPIDFGESPMDAAAALGDRGDSLREVAGQGGGLQGVADRLHATPESGQGRPGGKEMISDEADFVGATGAAAIATAVVGGAALLAGAPLIAAAAAGAGVVILAGGAGYAIQEYIDAPPSGTPPASATPPAGGTAPATDTTPTTGTAPATGTTPTPAVEPKMPLVPIVDGAASGGNSGVKDPGSSEDQVWKPPPGWIDGDSILPPGMRTGAVIGGAKGNDGVDWANQRFGASNPSPEATGGRGRPSDGEVWRRSQTNESMVGQPDDTGEANGGGGGTSQEERRAQAATPPPDDSIADGIGLGGDPGSINTDQNQNDLSDIDRPGGSDGDSKYPSLTISVTRHADDNDD
jgi:hypothetical protein